MGVLVDDAVENGLAEIGDGGEADVVDEIVAEIIADAAQEKDGEDRGGDHAVDAGDVRRHQVVEIDDVVREGDREEFDRRFHGLRIEDAVEDQLDQQSGHGLRGADDGHQDDGDEQMRNVGAGVAEEAGEFSHGRDPHRCRWSRL